jgi:hypothetical protein
MVAMLYVSRSSSFRSEASRRHSLLGTERLRALREGSNHSIYGNRAKGKVSSVRRHKEINDLLVIKIVATWKSAIPRRHNKPLQTDEQRVGFRFTANFIRSMPIISTGAPTGLTLPRHHASSFPP